MKLKRITFYMISKRALRKVESKQHTNELNEKYKDLVDTIVPNRKRKSFTGFDCLRYCNQMDYTMPFMIYVPKNKNGKLPLVIGDIKRCYRDEGRIPLLDYKYFVRKLKKEMKKNPCIILLPMHYNRSIFVEKDNTYDKGYDGIFNGLLEKVIREYPVDKNRIYIVGASNTAAGIWSQLRLHPEKYAAAIPMMGWCDDISDEYFEKIKNIPIWASHAENDTNVLIGNFNFDGNQWYGTDIIVEGLKKAGSTKIKYTRYKKYGHGASIKFLQNEDWHTWLFEQKKDN